ncbi:MAG TPA: nuclear transport factor 2 family protein [Candidatus Cybelea sp.]
MKISAALSLAIVCTLGCPQAAAAHDDGSLLPALQARYKILQAAVTAGDAGSLSTILAPHFVGIDVAGEADGTKALLAGLELEQSGPATVAMTISSPKERGDSLTVRRRLEIKPRNPGAFEDARSVEFVAYSTDTWVKVDGIWLLAKSTAQQLAYYVDGEQIARDVRTQ